MHFDAHRLLRLVPFGLGLAAAAIFILPGLSDGSSAYAGLASAEFVLPLLGVGVLIGQLPMRVAIVAVAVLAFGGVVGLWSRELVYGLLAPVPGAASHLFLAGPIACATVGLVLLLPPGLRPLFSLPAMAVAGAAVAIATRLSDPTLFAAHYPLTAPLLQAAIILSTAWAASVFRSPPAIIAARILGSWMFAAALLYGGAYVAARDTGLTPPAFAEFPNPPPEAKGAP